MRYPVCFQCNIGRLDALLRCIEAILAVPSNVVRCSTIVRVILCEEDIKQNISKSWMLVLP
jgi:hypothetical protein